MNRDVTKYKKRLYQKFSVATYLNASRRNMDLTGKNLNSEPLHLESLFGPNRGKGI